MNAAGYRRLQHRMESRGRMAGGLFYKCDCDCASHATRNQSPSNERTVVVTNGKKLSTSFSNPGGGGGAVQSWLLSRVQGVEVDITGGGVDHRRKLPCCFLCCDGYHHLHSLQREGAISADGGKSAAEVMETAAVDHSKKEQLNSATVTKEAVNVPSDAYVCQLTESIQNNEVNDVAGVKESSDSQQNKGSYSNLFNPAKSSLLLSSFIKLAESLPPKFTSAANSKSETEGENIEKATKSEQVAESSGGNKLNQKNSFVAERHCDVFNMPLAGKQGTAHVYEEPCVSLPLQSIRRSCINCSSVNALKKRAGLASKIDFGNTNKNNSKNENGNNENNNSGNDGGNKKIIETRNVAASAVQHGSTTKIVSASSFPGTSSVFVAPLATSINVSSQQPNDNVLLSSTLDTTAVTQPRPRFISFFPQHSSLLIPQTQQSDSLLKTGNSPLVGSELEPTVQVKPVTHSALLSAAPAPSAPTASITQSQQGSSSVLRNEGDGNAVTKSDCNAEELIEPVLAPGFSKPAPTAKNDVATSADLTFDDVINALRKKLFLEKADVGVQSSEEHPQQERQKEKEEEKKEEGEGERLVAEHEKEQPSQTLDQIMALLTRLHDEDQEVLEAMYENIFQEELEAPDVVAAAATAANDTVQSFHLQSAGGDQGKLQPPASGVPLQFPAEVMAAYGSSEPVAKLHKGVCTQTEESYPPQLQTSSPLEPQSLPPPLPPPPPAAAFTALPLLQTAPPAPVPPQPAREVMSGTEQPQSQQREMSSTPPVAATKTLPPGLLDGTAKAWVDYHFGSTLDAQHRELLQHVLLSREAEVRRAEAMETQCKELKAQFFVAKNTELSAAVEKSVPDSLRQWQQKRDEELTRVLALLNTKEEELLAVQKMQQEQKEKIEELARHMRSCPSEHFPASFAAAAGGSCGNENEKYYEETRHWKARCEAVEEQYRFSVQRLEELQRYIEQLRSGAQRAVMGVALGGLSPETVPVDTKNTRLSSDAQGLPAQQLTSQPNENLFSSPSTDPGRAAALKQLREDLETECVRFADETRRWNEYIKNQEKRWSQIRNR